MYPFNDLSRTFQKRIEEEIRCWEEYTAFRQPVDDALKAICDAASDCQEIEQKMRKYVVGKTVDAGLAIRKIWKRYDRIKAKATKVLAALRPKILTENLILDDLQAKISLKCCDGGTNYVTALTKRYEKHKELRDNLDKKCSTLIRSIKNAKRDAEAKERELMRRCPKDFRLLRKRLDIAYKKYEAALDEFLRARRKCDPAEQRFYVSHHNTYELQSIVLAAAKNAMRNITHD